MARFFDPKAHETGDVRLHAPATARNRDAILALFDAHLPRAGTLVEVASGTGEHAAHLAPALAPLHWQPTDIEPDHLASINAWRSHSGAKNILPAHAFNVLTDAWDFAHLPEPVVAMAAINLIHIAPWMVAEALIAGAGKLLPSSGVLFLYGPYKVGGAHTAPSNEAFDASLKSRNPAWGVRDREAVIDLAAQAGFSAPHIEPMPANNFSLIFRKS